MNCSSLIIGAIGMILAGVFMKIESYVSSGLVLMWIAIAIKMKN